MSVPDGPYEMALGRFQPLITALARELPDYVTTIENTGGWTMCLFIRKSLDEFGRSHYPDRCVVFSDDWQEYDPDDNAYPPHLFHHWPERPAYCQACGRRFHATIGAMTALHDGALALPVVQPEVGRYADWSDPDDVGTDGLLAPDMPMTPGNAEDIAAWVAPLITDWFAE